MDAPSTPWMHAAHDQAIYVDVILLTIITAYLMIAWQFWRWRGASGGSARTALLQLVAIFVMCSFCGYLPRIMPIPGPVLTAAHVILAVVAWAYAFSGNVQHLMRAVRYVDKHVSDEALESKIMSLDRETLH